MVLDVSVSRVYIPDWLENKKDATPIEIHHKAPSVALLNRLVPKSVFRMTTDKDGNPSGGESEFVMDYSKVVREMVTEVRNFSLNVDGKEQAIRTAADLFGDVPAVVSGLIDEVGQYLTALLQKKVVDPKN